ncbi:MAG: Hpt domain-containing protein [Nevskiales bacterium]
MRTNKHGINALEHEIKQGLDRVRVALEAYIEEEADTQSLATCLEDLHQVYGTLKMVGLHSAALLANDLHQALQAVVDGELEATEELFELAFGTGLQLSDYLDSVTHAQQDTSLILLPVINELRVALEKPVISESELFVESLCANPPEDVTPDVTVSGAGLEKVAAKKLAPFQAALLGVIKQAGGDHLQALKSIATDLQAADEHPANQRLWWVTAAVSEALADGGLEATNELKRLLGRLGLVLRGLAKQGTAALDTQAEILEYGLLFQLGRSNAQGELAQAVRSRYDLDSLLPSAEQLETTRARLRGPNTALLHSLAEEIQNDLAVVRDNLDLLMRAGELSEEHSSETHEALHRVAGTLGMLGLEDLQRVIKRQVEVIASVQDQPDPTSKEWQAVASGLLWVEHSLDPLLAQRERGETPDATAAEFTEGAISPRDLQAGAESILREALVNLSRIREQVEQFGRNKDSMLLAEAPRLLHEISAGLSVLDRQQAAGLIDRLSQALQNCQWDATSNTEQLERLADALVDAEALIDALRLDEGNEAAHLLELEGYIWTFETAAQPEAKAEGESFFDLELPDAEEAGIETELAAELPVEPPAAKVEVVDGIREIFLEEMDDIQSDLAETLPVWEKDTSNLSALGEVRRSFHTLKGSGRMAGSEALGAFGWAVEHLLNRCLEAEQPVTQDIIDLVHSAVAELPALAQSFAQDEPLSDTARALLLQAHNLAGTEAPAEWATAAAETTEEPLETAAADTPDTELPADMPEEAEEDIRQIFLGDALTHVEVLGQFLAESGDTLEPVLVTRDVVRAFHTLKSGAALAELQGLSDLCRALEHLCDASLSSGEPMDTELLQVLQHAGEEILVSLEAAQAGEALPDLGHLTQEVQELHSLFAPEVEEAEDAVSESLLAFTDEAIGLVEQIENHLSALELDNNNADQANRLLAAIGGLGDLARTNDIGAIASISDRMASVSGLAMSAQQRQVCADVALEIYGLLDELRQNRRDLEVEDLLARFDALPAAEEVLEEPLPVVEEPTEVEEFAAEDDAFAATSARAPQPEAELDEMLELFLGEGEELLEAIDKALDQWEQDLANTTPRSELLRNLHTIKGAARMAGAAQVADASHELESRIESQQRSGEAVDKPFLGDLRNDVDQLHGMLEGFRSGAVQAEAPGQDAAASVEAVELGQQATESWTDSLYWQPDEGESADQLAAQKETARVSVERLDAMLNEAGEVNIYRGRLEQQRVDLEAQLLEFNQAVERLRGLLRELDIQTDAQVHAGRKRGQGEGDRYDEHFDPLEMDRYTRMNELSRALNESAADLASLHGLMDETAHESETLLLQQGRVATSLQHGLMDTLLVPFTRQVQRLQRVVRQVSQSHARPTQIAFEGEDNELDRNVLERMTGPLEHLLRNAVVHGIEPAEERLAAGKSETGLIRVVLRRDGSQSIMEISDDGRGLNADAIREQAEKRGMIPKGTGLDDDLLWQFIFEPGFTTADEVTQEAGRGVGMDVVNAEIKQLGGTISVSSTPGEGTRFSIRIPSSLAITSALLVRVGSEQYAIPMASIDGVERISREDLDDAANDIIEYGGNQYQIAKLSEYVAAVHSATEEDEDLKSLPVVLIQAGETPLALVVDKVLGGQELVVKSLGPQVSAITGVKGGAILADGSVVLILDIQALHQRQRRRGLAGEAPEVLAPEQVQDERPMVMVVDDSITIRRVTEKFLLRNGFRVCTAKDGMDALPKLQTEAPDLVLLDIEMPRIDGFEFATYMRNNEHFERIPIIMITSRSGEKHQKRAAEIGVQQYMIKPYQEDVLLRSIQDVLHAAGGAA